MLLIYITHAKPSSLPTLRIKTGMVEVHLYRNISELSTLRELVVKMINRLDDAAANLDTDNFSFPMKTSKQSLSHGLERLRNNLYQLELTHPFPRSRRHFLTGILSDLTGLATQYDLNEISDRISDHLKDLGHSGGLRSVHACQLVKMSDMSTQSLHAPDLSNIAGKFPVLAQNTLSPPSWHNLRNLPQ